MEPRRALVVLFGVLTAFGGFIDIGDLVADALVGARFGLALAWVTVLAVVGIACYAEMAGRVAAAADLPTMAIVRDRLPRAVRVPLVALSVLVTATLVMAEMAGASLALQIATGVDYRWFLPGVMVLAVVVSTRWRLQTIESVFGLLGLTIVVYVAAVFALHERWAPLAGQAVPHVPAGGSALAYAFFAVSLIGVQMTPYELYFFSSGAVEHRWGPRRNALEIRSNVLIGFPLGGAVAIAIQAVAAMVLLPRGAVPSQLVQSLDPVTTALGETGFAVAIFAVFAVTFGATMETLLSSADTIAQYLDLPWGTERPWREARGYHAAIVAIVVAAGAFALSGVDPITVTVYAVILNAATLPFILYAVLRAGNDRALLGEHANGRLSRWLGTVVLAGVSVAGVLAIPLLVATQAF